MADRVCDLRPEERPRERLLEAGPEVLSDAELLAVLLRTGRRGSSAVTVARAVLHRARGVAGLARMDPAELVAVPGVGPAKAATVLAALELGRRAARRELERGQALTRPEAAGRYLVRRLAGLRQEVFGFLALDGRHRVLEEREVTVGTRTQAPVDPAELFRRALLAGAAALLVFHNHPSGVVEPSADDLELTRRLVAAGRALGVPVVDHLVVAPPRWLSLRAERPELFGP